mgnify:CR=1 FL=1
MTLRMAVLLHDQVNKLRANHRGVYDFVDNRFVPRSNALLCCAVALLRCCSVSISFDGGMHLCVVSLQLSALAEFFTTRRCVHACQHRGKPACARVSCCR